jgi:hypothetical protein
MLRSFANARAYFAPILWISFFNLFGHIFKSHSKQANYLSIHQDRPIIPPDVVFCITSGLDRR